MESGRTNIPWLNCFGRPGFVALKENLFARFERDDAFQANRLFGVAAELDFTGVAGVFGALTFASQFDLAVLENAVIAVAGFVDLIAGLFLSDEDERDFVAGDFSFANASAVVVAVELSGESGA